MRPSRTTISLLAADLLTGKADALVKDRQSQPRVYRVPCACPYRLSTRREIKLILDIHFSPHFQGGKSYVERKPAHSLFMSVIQDSSIPKYITRNRPRLHQRESCEVRFFSKKHAEGRSPPLPVPYARHKLLDRLGG
jgi:hypothetical protein